MRHAKDILDRFYTKSNIVDLILNSINIADYDLIIEPSAGNGAFSNKISKCLAFDIDPQDPKIQKQDFLEYKYEGFVDREKILCIGNPPFGKQCSLALKFIRKCTEFSDNIAFVLPKSFKKMSMQSKIHNNYHLENQIDIEDNSFLLDGESYNVPCIFQFWVNKQCPRTKLKNEYPIAFEYTTAENAHFVVRRVGYYSGKAYPEVDRSKESHYFIKVTKEVNLIEIIAALNENKWEHNNTSGPRSISKPELNKVLNRLLS